jgi:hypothetical protein
VIRPRTVALAVTVALAGVVPATDARAAGPESRPLELDATRPVYHSPQHFALEFKFGLYSPHIDNTSGLTGRPFAEEFNSQTADNPAAQPKGQPLFTLEFDWQFWHRFGSLALAASLGYNGRKTHSFQYIDNQATPCTPTVNCVRSTDTNTLNIMPITLMLVYRFDVLALRWSVPVVPYLKVGLAYYFWFMQAGDGSLSKSLDGKSQAIGGVPGWVLQPGIAIMLDAIDKRAGAVLDTELGINHVYVFGELNYADVTGLGIFKDKINLSDTTWNVGLAFEF